MLLPLHQHAAAHEQLSLSNLRSAIYVCTCSRTNTPVCNSCTHTHTHAGLIELLQLVAGLAKLTTPTSTLTALDAALPLATVVGLLSACSAAPLKLPLLRLLRYHVADRPLVIAARDGPAGSRLTAAQMLLEVGGSSRSSSPVPKAGGGTGLAALASVKWLVARRRRSSAATPGATVTAAAATGAAAPATADSTVPAGGTPPAATAAAAAGATAPSVLLVGGGLQAPAAVASAAAPHSPGTELATSTCTTTAGTAVQQQRLPLPIPPMPQQLSSPPPALPRGQQRGLSPLRGTSPLRGVLKSGRGAPVSPGKERDSTLLNGLGTSTGSNISAATTSVLQDAQAAGGGSAASGISGTSAVPTPLRTPVDGTSALSKLMIEVYVLTVHALVYLRSHDVAHLSIGGMYCT
jgi:hypothetical protein